MYIRTCIRIWVVSYRHMCERGSYLLHMDNSNRTVLFFSLSLSLSFLEVLVPRATLIKLHWQTMKYRFRMAAYIES